MKRYSLGEQLHAARIKKELSLYDVEKFSGVKTSFSGYGNGSTKALPEEIRRSARQKVRYFLI